MKTATKELAEFETLVNEIKGDCDKCTQDCRLRLQWLDSLVRAQREAIGSLVDAVQELRGEIVQLRADRQICGQLNLLCAGDSKPKKVGEQPCQTKRNSGQCHTLDRFVKTGN